MWSPELVLLCLFRPSVFVPVSLWLIWTFISLIISFLLRTGMEHLVATKHSRGHDGGPEVKKDTEEREGGLHVRYDAQAPP